MEVVVSAIIRVVEEIVKAVETDRENSESCLDLAGRARTVGDIIHRLDSSTASMISSGSGYTPSLERLKAALDDALKLVKSHESRGFAGGFKKLITSSSTAAKFQSIQTRITACVVDVGLAKEFARHRAQHHKSNGARRRSPRLVQQNQSFQSEEWSTQQQRSSHTTPPSQQHQNIRQHQQQRRLQSGESSSQQQQNSQSAVRSPQQRRSRRQHPDSKPAAQHHYRRRSALTPNQARELASAISSQPALPPRGAGAAAP